MSTTGVHFTILRQVLEPPNFMKFGIRGQLTDVITCVKFLVDRFRGYGVLTPQNCHFPLTCCVALATVWHCRATLYWSQYSWCHYYRKSAVIPLPPCSCCNSCLLDFVKHASICFTYVTGEYRRHFLWRCSNKATKTGDAFGACRCYSTGT